MLHRRRIARRRMNRTRLTAFGLACAEDASSHPHFPLPARGETLTMPSSFGATDEYETAGNQGRRKLLRLAAVMAAGSPLGVAAAQPIRTGAGSGSQPAAQPASNTGIGKGLIGYMLAHGGSLSRFMDLETGAASGGFHMLATAIISNPGGNKRHSGAAWVTLGALRANSRSHGWNDGRLSDLALLSGRGREGIRDDEHSVLRPNFLGVGSARRSMNRPRPVSGRNGKSDGIA